MMPRENKPWGWPRLEVYLPSEQARRRVKLVAAAQDKKLSDYCLEAILERLGHDEVQTRTGSISIAAELRSWQQTVRTKTGAKRIPDTAVIIQRLRRERIRAGAGLR
jgi:hypothetical protein